MLKKIAFTTASLLCVAGLLFAAKAYTRDTELFETLAPYRVSGQVAEIASVSPDGLTLAYTDSKSRAIGWVDITDPTSPRELATYKTGGEPTSVAYTRDGNWPPLPANRRGWRCSIAKPIACNATSNSRASPTAWRFRPMAALPPWRWKTSAPLWTPPCRRPRPVIC